LGGLDWDLHWSIKFPLIVVTAVGLLLLSYHYLVRNTYFGEILNGLRHLHKVTSMAPSGSETRVADGKLVVAELFKVRKRYGVTQALDGVDLKIHAGELLALLGPNGAGKSTAVSCLLGLEHPDEGTALVFGSPPQAIESRRQV